MRRFLFLTASIALITTSTVYASPPDPPGKDPVTVEAAKYLQVQTVYLSQVGVVEATANNDGPQVERYLKAAGLTKGYPWCSAFVRWCYDQAGVRTRINAYSPTSQNLNNLVYAKGQLLKDPRAADVVTFYYPALKRIGHTGFYDGKINSSIYRSVEGNTSGGGGIVREGGGVYVKYRSLKATYSISRWT